MKKFFAVIAVMCIVFAYVSCDKSSRMEKWTAEAEIIVQQAKLQVFGISRIIHHAKLHVLDVPHVEIIVEAESGEVDYLNREIRMDNVKSFSSNKHHLEIPESMKLSLQLPIPSGCAALITINGKEYFLPYVSDTSTDDNKTKI